MLKEDQICKLQDIEFRIVYSGRRTLGISVLPDATVIVRAPYRTSLKTITGIVQQKAGWIVKHRDSVDGRLKKRLNGQLASGEIHFYRGQESVLQIKSSIKPSVRFFDNTIELGLSDTEDIPALRRLLNIGYKMEALKVFPGIFKKILSGQDYQIFNPKGLVIRSMKSRWGSCSRKGIITLSTELVKLPDIFIEYVIIHELCHLEHHNHGKEYYKLLSKLFPDWKHVRKELKGYIQ
jgi:predicted metal-dependent hydrolase